MSVLNEQRAKHKAAKQADAPTAAVVPEEPWPELIPFDDLAPPPPFPLDVYAPTIRAVIDTVSRDTRAPIDYAACTVLSTAAASIGGTCNAIGKGGWTEQPALWIGLIGAPSVKKTPTMKLIQGPLKKANAKRIERAKANDVLRGATVSGEHGENEPRIYDNDEGMILVNDCTAEGIMSLYSRQRRGIIYTRSEISAWLNGFGQYKTGGGNDRQMWIELYDGGDYHKHNVSKEIHCGVICQNICGGIQPGIVADFLDVSDGMDARFLWCYPVGQRATKEDGYTADKSLLGRWGAIIDRLLGLDYVTELDTSTREEKRVPHLFRMNPEAWERWVEFTAWQADILNDEGTSSKMRDMVGKAEGFALRIAITLRMLAEASDEVRQKNTLERLDIDRAARLFAYFYGMAQRVYGVAQQNSDADRLNRLVAWMGRWAAKRGAEGEVATFTDREAYSMNRIRYSCQQDVRTDLWRLRDHGYIREVPTEKRRVDSATLWEPNPAAVVEGGAK